VGGRKKAFVTGSSRVTGRSKKQTKRNTPAKKRKKRGGQTPQINDSSNGITPEEEKEVLYPGPKSGWRSKKNRKEGEKRKRKKTSCDRTPLEIEDAEQQKS